MRLSLTKLAAAAGGVAFALTAGSGIASADPLDPVINTTCNYGQVMQALQNFNADHWAQFNASPMATSYLQQFLASAPPQRLQMARQIQAMPQAAPYFADVVAVANTCSSIPTPQ